nr:hypothetical protein [Tanacetum cinerariifolium]
MRDQRRQARVEGVRTELEYSNEESDEEIEAEPRHCNPLRSNETTPARRNGRRELRRRIELGNKWPGERQGVANLRLNPQNTHSHPHGYTNPYVPLSTTPPIITLRSISHHLWENLVKLEKKKLKRVLFAQRRVRYGGFVSAKMGYEQGGRFTPWPSPGHLFPSSILLLNSLLPFLRAGVVSLDRRGLQCLGSASISSSYSSFEYSSSVRTPSTRKGFKVEKPDGGVSFRPIVMPKYCSRAPEVTKLDDALQRFDENEMLHRKPPPSTIFKLGHPPDLATYTTLVNGLVLADRVFEAVELFKKLSRHKLCDPDQIMYGTVINGLCKVGHISKALELLSFMESGSCKPGVEQYNAMIDGLCKDRMVDDALRLFTKMIGKGVHANVITYSSLINGLCNFGRESEAARILINGYCKKKKFEEAINLFREIRNKGLIPNGVTYNSMLQDYDMPHDQEENPDNDDEEPKEKVASKHEWFTKPTQPQEPTDPDWNVGKTPQQGQNQSWLMTLASSAEKPSKTFDELMSTPIDFSAFVMNGLNINNLTQETLLGPAFRLLKGTQSIDYPFDLTKPLPLVKIGNLQKAPVDYFFNNDLKYLQGGISTMTYRTSLTKTKAAQYDLPGIEDMRRWSTLEKKRAIIMIKVIDKQLKERRMMRSLEKFVGGKDYRTDLRLLHLSYCVRHHKAMMSKMRRSSRRNLRLLLISHCHSPRDHSRTSNNPLTHTRLLLPHSGSQKVINSTTHSNCVKMKHYSTALSLLKQIHFIGIPWNIYTFNISINWYSRLKQVNYSFALLATIFKLGHPPDLATYNTLLNGLVLADRVFEAVELFKKLIRDKLCEPNQFMYGTVINCLCKVGHASKALELFRFLEKGSSCAPNQVMYSTIIDSLCKESEAARMLIDMEEKGVHPDTRTYTTLVNTFCKQGSVKDAELVVQAMERRGLHPDVITYRWVLFAW